MKNTVYTIEEYMAQGFTAEEAPIARKTDIMYELINVMNGEVVASVNYINTARMLQLLVKETTYIREVKIS